LSVIPCNKDELLTKRINEFAEVLKTQAHTLGTHGLNEQEFYDLGVFRGAIERVRGQFSAAMVEKRDFVRHVLNFMEDGKFIKGWNSSGAENRHDYVVTLNSGRFAVIELKGCLDGNNTNIFERPANAHEFIIWSVCTNTGGNPRRNAWSGLHTRLSAEIISKSLRVDGMIIWDWLCGTVGRKCPKLVADSSRITEVSHFRLPPPCIYLMPATTPSTRNNPNPPAQELQNVEILNAFYSAFKVNADELNYVTFEVAHDDAETVRTTTVKRNGEVQIKSKPTAIRRS
jgi:hypothetical protein